MPTDTRILGFSNRWYSQAVHHSEAVRIDHELKIRLVTAPFFLATKIDAFLSWDRIEIFFGERKVAEHQRLIGKSSARACDPLHH